MPKISDEQKRIDKRKKRNKAIIFTASSILWAVIWLWIGGYAMTNLLHINPILGSIVVVIAIMVWVVIFLWIYGRKWIFGKTQKYKKPLIIISVLIVLVIGLGGWLGKQVLIDSFPKPSHQVAVSIFGSPSQDNFSVNVGTYTNMTDTNELEQHPVDVAQIGLSQVTALMDKGKFFVNVTISDGIRTVSINYDNPTKMPKGWDYNNIGSECEIVNAQLQPIFQMTYDSLHANVTINGIFPLDRSTVVVATNAGLLMGVPTTSVNFTLNRIFKYPSWKYPHQLVNTTQ
jgi:hypothetical protein